MPNESVGGLKASSGTGHAVVRVKRAEVLAPVMELQRILPARLGRFLGYLAVGLLFIVLFAAYLDRGMPLWFPNFSSAVAGASFLAIGVVLFFLGGHIYGSMAGMWAQQAGIPISGMFAMRAAGEDKLDDVREEDLLKTVSPSRERVLMLISLALIFLMLSILVTTVPASWIAIVAAAIFVTGVVLLDRGVRWAAAS